MRQARVKRERRAWNRVVIRYSVWFYRAKGENREEQTPISFFLFLIPYASAELNISR